MNNTPVLTHPAFNRPPVLNARRHGPTPRGIPMLHRERFERGYAKQKAEEASLRAWASEYGNAQWSLDQIRREKQRSDAKDLLEKRNDVTWQKVEQLQQDAAALLHEASRLKCLLVELQLGELAHE
ncbi:MULTISPECIES: hypothetical protein [Burkholderia]|uniref:hypothetical protein n=2 Tax=Burkholderia TaxID=32008 RepID=UPI0012DAF4B2|nr:MULTISPECIES: hypothetical protein [Burkholderia]